MKQVLILLFVLALFIVATALQAQTTGAVAGNVTDENGNPIPGGTVLVVGTRRGTATDANGAFCIHGLLPGTQTVRITSIGYTDTVTCVVTVKVAETAEVHRPLQREKNVSSSCVLIHDRIRRVDANTTGKITEISGEEMLR